MGLDNSIAVHSNCRKITRSMLPEGLVYPWNEELEEGVEILYWRKNWGLRNAVLNYFDDDEKYEYTIETSQQVFDLIRIIVSFMDENKWEDEGDSIWEYNEILPTLQQNIINLAIIASFMRNNPDVYLIFYDSY